LHQRFDSLCNDAVNLVQSVTTDRPRSFSKSLSEFTWWGSRCLSY
jgi:hypothetical protein